MQFPFLFWNTQELSMSVQDQKAIINERISGNNKLGGNELVISDTSDSEPSRILRMDKYFNLGGPKRCICHNLALAVNYSVV